MQARSDRELALLTKIRGLTDERVNEVEDFVDFLRSRDVHHQLIRAAMTLSEASLAAVWDNTDDDVYDEL